MTRSETEPFTNSLEPFTNTEGEAKVANAPARARNRDNLRCSMPKSLQFRLRAVIIAERRTPAVVYDKIIEDFLAVGEYEPRPYTPMEFANEDTESHSYSLAPALYSKLRERADYEGRSPQSLFIRATYDYINASPDDPMKQRGEVA